MKFSSAVKIITALVLLPAATPAAEYRIDTAGMHAFIEFKVNHLGFSLVSGRFNRFDGRFGWDKNNPASSDVEVIIETGSVDTNHRERDNHLLSSDYLNVARYPEATFQSIKYEGDRNRGKLTGNLTLNGVTREISLDIERIGEGPDPWGGYRAGFVATTTLHAPDFGYGRLVPARVELSMSLEGIRQ